MGSESLGLSASGTGRAAAVPAVRSTAGLPGCGQLWREQTPGLLRAAIALGCGPEDAADLVQDTLLAAFRSINRFDPARGSFGTWTHAILVRRWSNWWRAKQRLRRALQLLSHETAVRQAPSSDAVEARLTLERLAACLSRAQRRVWVLVEIAGLTSREAAGALCLREATIRSHLRYARAALRRALHETRLR